MLFHLRRSKVDACRVVQPQIGSESRTAMPREMMMNPSPSTSIDSALPPPEPCYFSSGDNRLFGWVHAPAQTASDLGVVICSPFGYESICSHRSVRAFAESIAGLGFPTLRFDYAGTGDSADTDENDDQLTFWVNDVLAAIAALRRATRVNRICLMGIRLGSLLAALASSQSELVDSLILIGPVLSGRKYVRELRMTQMAGIALSG